MLLYLLALILATSSLGVHMSDEMLSDVMDINHLTSKTRNVLNLFLIT